MTDQPDRGRGGFPDFEVTEPEPGFTRYLSAVRTLQDLSVCAAPDDSVWDKAADGIEELIALLDPARAPEGVSPAGRIPSLAGMGSLLLPPFRIVEYGVDGVAMGGRFSRFHVGGNGAVHGGVLPLLFDWLCGMVVHGAQRPISRTAYLKVDYRAVTPIDTPLTVRGRVEKVEGRKAFISGELVDGDEKLLAELDALMVQLLPGQP
ncbi:PaaI family thioesterase [Mycolicibacillus trivialis]|uniref:Acyl-coenzyme A thioesterase THEM4 n=1 Tax=Mycolicibacillus trivialis TaxID=1798 RepID=A0A1X2EMU5_9MYCO|nr:PaaI family thioesterase [Mycolicibacillus trivialis]ORX06922.1 thioesterase [Mycolicibacillus trivialis]